MFNQQAGLAVPPPPPSAAGQHQTYNPKHHFQAQAQAAGSMPFPPPPPPSEQMSATYIPTGDTIGVGIPGLGMRDEDISMTMAQNQWNMIQNQNQNQSANDTLSTPLNETSNRDNLYAAAMQKQGMMAGGAAGASMMSNARSAAAGIPPELAAQWTMDKVLLWLQANSFSKDWQETFKSLNLHGSQFLQLGGREAGRGNFGMMHQEVYPRLAKECSNSGTGWDQAREREEGKRMRRLIRAILTGRQAEPSNRAPSHSRTESSSGPGVASAGGDSADSPNVSCRRAFGRSIPFNQANSSIRPPSKPLGLDLADGGIRSPDRRRCLR
jgi:mitogen-activated protein kinase kinase kinase